MIDEAKALKDHQKTFITDALKWTKRPLLVNLAGLCWVFNFISIGRQVLSLVDESERENTCFYRVLYEND